MTRTSLLVFVASLCTVAVSARAIDVVDTWMLNRPTMECFKTFPVYEHAATGWIYYDATITCATLKAFISYGRRVHVRDLG